jgi:transcription initiation factor TFIIH subunit 4
MAKNSKRKKSFKFYFILKEIQRKIKRYFPTKLAIELASGLTSSTFSDQQRGNDEIQSGFLIVETNYRVYAYTSSFR